MDRRRDHREKNLAARRTALRDRLWDLRGKAGQTVTENMTVAAPIDAAPFLVQSTIPSSPHGQMVEWLEAIWEWLVGIS